MSRRECATAFHENLAENPPAWGLWTDPLPPSRRFMDSGDGYLLELANCRRCSSTITRRVPACYRGSPEPLNERGQLGLLDLLVEESKK